jgi:hypothetical protein
MNELSRAVEENGTMLTKIVFFGVVGIVQLIATILLFPFKFIWGVCEILYAFLSTFFEPKQVFSTGLFIAFVCPILLFPILAFAMLKQWREDRQDPVWYHA